MKTILKDRIEKLMQLMTSPSIVVLYSGKAVMRSEDEEYPFSVNRNFYYFTEIDQENSILLIQKNLEEKTTATLYIKAQDPVMAKWVGSRLSIEEVRIINEFESIHYMDEFSDEFHAIIRKYRSHKLHLGLDLWKYNFDQADTSAHQLAHRVQQNYPAVIIDDIYESATRCRIIKSEDEIEKMRIAQNTTKLAIEELLSYAKPGMNECELEGCFDFSLKKQGVSEHAFPSIVAGGKRAATLHYHDNNQIVEDGELVLLDLGSAHNHYCADISRTFPINGTFTKRQKELYSIVLSAQDLITHSAKPGITLTELNNMLISFYDSKLEELGLKKNGKTVNDYYFHGVSHHLGLDTHDISCSTFAKLEPGMVITVEPGLYIEEESIGIRIEHDILITKDGAEDLSKGILKTIDEIEAWMKNSNHNMF